MGSLQLPEILLIAFILLLIFGVGKISKIGGELGQGIKAFKDGMSGKSETDVTDQEKKETDNQNQD
ncbi:MAG: twin-arginine translocase TatA/TatE family subunit [Chloroflexi bacterium]|nr:twin-arginine translocase TatA/TatE family subunit [Chloroflexota bacterium]